MGIGSRRTPTRWRIKRSLVATMLQVLVLVALLVKWCLLEPSMRRWLGFREHEFKFELLYEDDATPTTLPTNGAQDGDARSPTKRDRSAKFMADPNKYDREGRIRESYVLHNLPSIKFHCNSKRNRTLPGIEGLPVNLLTHIDLEDIFVHRGNVVSLLGDFFGGVANTSHYLKANGRSIMRAHSWRSCAIVGNSGNLLSTRFGAVIDKHDVVLRLNQAPTVGFEEFVASKTTFRLLNPLWLQRYSNNPGKRDAEMERKPATSKDTKPLHPTELPMEKGTTMLLTRVGKSDFESFVKYWATRRPDVSVLMLNSHVVSVVRQLLSEYRDRLCKAGFGPYLGGTNPSSGLVGTYVLLQLCDSVTAYGFDTTLDARGLKRQAPYHYYTSWGSRLAGNEEAHSFETEVSLMKELLNPKREHPPKEHWWPNRDPPTPGSLRMCQPTGEGPFDRNNYLCSASNRINL